MCPGLNLAAGSSRSLFDRNFPSQSEALFTVALLERLYLAGKGLVRN